MTLKEAYDKAKEGQRIRRRKWGDLGARGFIKENIGVTDNIMDIKDAFADDWEIVGEKKKVVIENVMWEYRDFGREISPFVWGQFPDRSYFVKLLRNQEIDGIKMKMTLEWEE